MRKRDRERLAGEIEEIAYLMHERVTGQVHGAAWYVRANAGLKGCSFAHAALQNAEHLVKRLRAVVGKLDRKT